MEPGRPRSSGEHAPRHFLGVTVSSTFRDLQKHRDAVIAAIHGLDLYAVSMEAKGATPGEDLIDSSLRMVREGAGYIGIISRRYGQIPPSKDRNPDGLSITELEFKEALELRRPILLFVMDRNHPLIEDDVELDPDKRKKLDAFRERAKRMSDENPVHRIYDNFSSFEDFLAKANRAVARLRDVIEPVDDGIPEAPALYAEPAYTGSHKFLGRRAQLATLDDWAAAADPNPVLLFDAIGGTGKSILTWTWINQNAPRVRSDWAGRFWYSFYEKGADMGDFCRRALAYMTGRPLEKFRGKKTAELRPQLRLMLHSRPWLVVMDGLERILVAYNRIDAAELRDEEANAPTDRIADRDPRSTIRSEDGDLLRDLAANAPSKVLVTSRLIPTTLLAPGGLAIPGVRCESLPGLLAEDAEQFFRACGVNGDSQVMRDYLKRNCDCHPLVIGVLAGLVSDYLPEPGNFDRWVEDPNYGARLDLGALDLIQRRNHILRAAITALLEESRRLLSLLALLSDAVDYHTLRALNPLPPPDAVKTLDKAITDLKRRGLLQFDRPTNRYDLHPVVRCVASTGLEPEDKEGLGQRVLDHFTARAHNPWEQASSLDDLREGLHVVRTFIKMGKLQGAFGAYRCDLANALMFNLEAYAEVLSILRSFFPEGWAACQPTYTI